MALISGSSLGTLWWTGFAGVILCGIIILVFPQRAWLVMQSAVPIKEPEVRVQTLLFVQFCASVSKTLSCWQPASIFIDTWSCKLMSSSRMHSDHWWKGNMHGLFIDSLDLKSESAPSCESKWHVPAFFLFFIYFLTRCTETEDGGFGGEFRSPICVMFPFSTLLHQKGCEEDNHFSLGHVVWELKDDTFDCIQFCKANIS